MAAIGVDGTEVAAELVNATTWMAKTIGRAGYAEAASKRWDRAFELARGESGSRELVAQVYRAGAQRHLEQGRRVRAKLDALRAAAALRK